MKEVLWRLHWRDPDGLVSFWPHPMPAKETFASLPQYVASYKARTYWIQPDGTEPALKPGTEPVRWRVHYRNRCWTATQVAREDATFNAMAEAQARADYEARRWPSLDHWIQPELADVAKPEPKPATIPIHYRFLETGETGTCLITPGELIRQGAIWKAAKDCGIEFLTEDEKREKDQVWRLWSIRVEDGTRTKTPFCGTVKELAERIGTCTLCGTGSYVYSVEREDAA